MGDWVDFGDGLPVSLNTCIARPFYRDGKIRIASYGKGIWESAFQEQPTVPIAQVMVDRMQTTQHCEQDTFRYVCHSMLNHTNATWEWTFQGGTPATADTWHANVAYAAPGTYLTILTVTDGTGHSDTDSLYVTVNGFTPLATVSENFEAAFPPTGFEIVNDDEDITWEMYDGVGGFGNSSHCMYIRGYDYWPGGAEDDAVVSVDMTYLQDAWLTFDVAYARWGGGYSDSLEVLVSTDCGANYQSLYFRGGTDIATASDNSSDVFVPSSSQWRTDSIDLSGYMGNDDVLIVFRFHSGWGQHMYLDNINLSAVNVVSVTEPETEKYLSIYPNPVAEGSSLQLRSNLNEPIMVDLYSVEGKRIYRNTHSPNASIPVPAMAQGSYICVLRSSALITKEVLVVR